jgi:predicted Fe-Mo cluster-binding NifX family protein
MLIAVTTDGRELTSAVSETFESCRFLLIVETDDMRFDVYPNDGDPKALTGELIGRDCEAVITGGFSLDTFNIIADACITRYDGTGLTALDALERMDRNILGYIKNADGSDSCQSHGESCDCGEHE